MCMYYFLWTLGEFSSAMTPLHSQALQCMFPKNLTLVSPCDNRAVFAFGNRNGYNIISEFPVLIQNGPNNFLCRKSNLFFWPRTWSRLAVPLVIMPLWCPFICVCSWESVSWPWRFFKSTDWFLCKMFLSSGSSEVSSWLDSDHMFLAARPRKWYSFFSGSWDTSYQFVPFPVILTLILKMESARFLFYRIPIFLLVIHK